MLNSTKYNTLFFATGALLSVLIAAIFWFSLMWYVAGSGLFQMWTAVHLITFTIGFVLSFGLSVSQAEHIPEVIYRASQLGSKAIFLIPVSTGFRAISDSLLPSANLSIGEVEFNSVEVFTYATSLALVLFLIFTLFSWLAEKRGEAG
jgi:hypothetical protein